MTRTTRHKLRVITVASAIWAALVAGVTLWPQYPVGSCPDSPPDTAYVCRVGYADDFRTATARRNLLIGVEGAILIAAASILWLLQEPGEPLLPGRRDRSKRAGAQTTGSIGGQETARHEELQDSRRSHVARASELQGSGPRLRSS